MKSTYAIIPCLIALGAGACGGGSSPAPQDPSDVSMEGESAGSEESMPEEGGDAPSKKWAEMNDDEKMEFMGTVILPEMKKVFQEADPEGYAEFKCETCHGPDAEKVNFKMPNGLYALPKEGTIEASKEYDAAVTAFMLDKVVPRMAELMSMEPVKELNCFSCHETEE